MCSHPLIDNIIKLMLFQKSERGQERWKERIIVTQRTICSGYVEAKRLSDSETNLLSSPAEINSSASFCIELCPLEPSSTHTTPTLEELDGKHKRKKKLEITKGLIWHSYSIPNSKSVKGKGLLSSLKLCTSKSNSS